MNWQMERHMKGTYEYMELKMVPQKMEEKKNAIDNFTIWDDVRSYFRESAESYFWIDTVCKKSESDNTRVCLHIKAHGKQKME